MKILNWIMLILLVVGGVNRGLYAWLDLNLVALVFPDVVTKSVDATGIESTVTTISMLAKIVYSLVTVGALRTLVGEIKKA
jgi:hypothetical protein